MLDQIYPHPLRAYQSGGFEGLQKLEYVVKMLV